MTTRRKFGFGGIAAIISAQRAPAALVRSLVAGRHVAATGTRLPYDAEVEYIGVGATIGPYIDTGYAWASDNIKIDIEFMRIANPAVNTGLFGSQKNGVDTNWGIQFWCPVASEVRHYVGSSAEVLKWYPDVNQKYRFIGQAKSDHTWSIDINGDVHTGVWSGTVHGNVTTVGLFTLANNSGMTARRTNNVFVYSFKLTDDGALVRDFMPVRFTNELGQSEVAIYDRANPTVGMNQDGSPRDDGLYRNRGTGAFVIGPVKARGASGQNGGGYKWIIIASDSGAFWRPHLQRWRQLPSSWKEAA